MNELKLDLTDNQLAALLYALEFTSRIGIGQFDRIADLFPPGDGASIEAWHSATDDVDRACKAAFIPTMTRYGSLGIHNPKVHVHSRRAWELLRVIQHSRQHGGVWNQSPMPCDDGPIPVCKITSSAAPSAS